MTFAFARPAAGIVLIVAICIAWRSRSVEGNANAALAHVPVRE